VSGTLSLNWRQKALYRFGELKPTTETGRDFAATATTQAIVDEARRQYGRGSVLRYEPRHDPRLGTYAELKRLQQAGLAERETPGVWRLDGWRLTATLRERRPPLLSVATLKRLQETQVPTTGTSGFTPVAAPDTATRQAFAELEARYPRACRATAHGYQLNALPLRKALYTDRTRFVALWVQEQNQPAAVARGDHRLASALAASRVHGDVVVYHPDDESSGKAAQTVRYLRGLALRRDQQAVRFGQGGSFLIDQQEAINLLNGHRQALLAYAQRQGRPEATLAPPVVAAFARNGQPERDGSWLLTPRAGQNALVWRLHQSAALSPTAVTQQPDGRYCLSPEAARAYALPRTPAWAQQMSARHAGLEGRTAELPRPDFCSVVLKDERAPLTGTLAASTQATYARVARRQRQLPLEARPHYLV
jgi:hypothetical protein